MKLDENLVLETADQRKDILTILMEELPRYRLNDKFTNPINILMKVKQIVYKYVFLINNLQ